MNIVETAVVPDAVKRALRRTVVAQLADVSGEIFVVGRHSSAVTEAAQILLDNKAQADRVAELTDGKVVAASADGLGAILHHKQIMGFGDFRDLPACPR